MKKVTRDLFTENPNVEAFVIFHGAFFSFYIAINKGAPIEKRIKSIFKPDGFAWAEDVAYNCYITVVPQSKKAHDAFIAYFIANQPWAESLRCFWTEVLPYERSSFNSMKGGMYYISDDALENCERWKYSFGHFGLSLSYNDSNIHLPFIEDEAIPEYVRPLMRHVVAACSHLGKDQEEKVKEISAILGGIYGEMYGKEISAILG
jgi:hypothetical protein